MFSDFIDGFLIELALVVTVGLQNAFILRQGIRREFTVAVVLTCAFCECVLVTIGIAGMGAILTSLPTLLNIITWLGICFLILFAIKSLYNAYKSNESLDINIAKIQTKTPSKLILAAIAICWLNPHVILDSTLMGAFAAQYYPHHWIFGAGVYAGAFVWFCFLGILGRTLAKPLNSPKTWKVINVIIALLCVYMAFNFVSDINKPHDHTHGLELLHEGHDH